MKKVSVKWLVTVAMLSSVGFILMLIKFPIPLLPPFLKIDFSDVPTLLAALIMGPLAGVVVELMKNVLDFFVFGSETGIPIGHISNFFSGITFILPAYYIYKKFKSVKGMTYGLIAGTLVMTVFMTIFNYYVILPAYMGMLNLNSVEIMKMVVLGIIPFNLIKGTAVTIVFLVLFGRMEVWVKQKSLQYSV